jgi:hypothetical protein
MIAQTVTIDQIVTRPTGVNIVVSRAISRASTGPANGYARTWNSSCGVY